MLEWCGRAAPCALLVIATSWACQEEETRPGFAQDCNDAACLDARGDSFPLPLPTAPGDDNGGSAGSGGMSGTAGEIAGSVREVAMQDLVTTQSLVGDVDVRASNANASDDDVVVQPADDGSYRLEGMLRGDAVWVGVGNFDDPPSEPYMDTLQAVDSRGAGVTDLLVMRTDMLRELASTSFLNQSVELGLDRAHLIIRFVRVAGTTRVPLPGVAITFPEPENVATAYDAGATYSDGQAETGDRGMAVLLNLDAPVWPGGQFGIVANYEEASLTMDVQLARGAVTIVTAVVPDP